MSAKRHKGKRKAKQDLKPADQGVVRVETEQVASAVEIQVEVGNFAGPGSLGEETERLASAVELQDELESFASPVSVLDENENTTGAVMESAAAEKTAPSSAAKTGADRRTHPRYAFTAAVEVIATEPGERLKTRVRDLSQQGCNVDTDNPFPLGTVTEVRIKKGAESFEAHARVVYNQPGKGMGVMFTVVEPEQFATLNKWIAESREVSWLAANRRRSQRVLMKLPVRVSGQGGGAASFEEDAYTLAISAHGALIAVEAPVYRGQRFTLANVQTKATLECVVAHVDKIPGERTRVGVEFMLPNQTFWRVAFPPKDWTPRHPDAKTG
jgi:PilZ domain-containing protein